MKICTCCKLEKPISEFNIRKLSRDGYTTRCKSCLKIAKAKHYQENKEKILSHNKNYRETNIEKCKSREKDYYLKNKEKILDSCKNWASKNKDRVREIHRKHAENNINSIRESKRKWNRSNLEYCRASQHRRRARKIGNGGTHTVKDITSLKVSQNNLCVYCESDISENYHIDHIIPLVLGGSNNPDNLQLLCPTCNRRKGAKHPEDFQKYLEKDRPIKIESSINN